MSAAMMAIIAAEFFYVAASASYNGNLPLTVYGLCAAGIQISVILMGKS